MITRQWIYAILWDLPVWYWPVFFLEVARFKAWWATGPIDAGTMVVLGVTVDGHIVIDALYRPAEPVRAGWAQHVPRAPWARLTLTLTPTLAPALADGPARAICDTATAPSRHPCSTLPALTAHLAPP